MTLTPWEPRGAVLVKREDLYEYAGVRGGKVRTCEALCKQARAQGLKGVVTAGSRQSPQVEIVAHVARELGLRAVCYVPSGPSTPQLDSARAAGAEVVPVKPGHNSVIKARAREYAAQRGNLLEIPFGMETAEVLRQVAPQVAGLPEDVQRLVVPVGSGMTLCGILAGLDRVASSTRYVEVLGVCVGADPRRRLDRWYPGWRWLEGTGLLQLVDSPHDYHAEVQADVGGLVLDPVYEAKCAEYLQPGDGLWVVGVRRSVVFA